MATTCAGEPNIDTCFPLSQEHRRRLLQGDYRPLRFEFDAGAEQDGLPDGCEPGATYVLAWSPSSRSAVGGIVIEIPREPLCWLTITKVGRHKSGDWLVRFDVTDLRERVLFLAPGNGYTASRWKAIDDLEVIVPDKHIRAISERDHGARMKQQEVVRMDRHRRRRERQRGFALAAA